MDPKSTRNKHQRVNRIKDNTLERLKKEKSTFKEAYPIYFSYNFNDALLYL